jgi:hypothetical protein
MKHGQEGVEIGSDAEIQWVAHLLQIHAEGIRKCLTTKITVSGIILFTFKGIHHHQQYLLNPHGFCSH